MILNNYPKGAFVYHLKAIDKCSFFLPGSFRLILYIVYFVYYSLNMAFANRYTRVMLLLYSKTSVCYVLFCLHSIFHIKTANNKAFITGCVAFSSGQFPLNQGVALNIKSYPLSLYICLFKLS